MSAPARQHVATVEEHAPPAQVVATDAASLMAVISRAASDPATDVDKLERLLGMYERITSRNAETAFNEAMNLAQSEMRPVAANANNSQTHSKYANFAALDHALRPIYTNHGFSLSYGTSEGAPADYVRVICHVAHAAGYSRTYHVDMPADGKGAKGNDVMTKTHATGAAMTYGQRYLLKLIFNMAVGEDMDGNPPAARNQSPASEAAIAGINACNTSDELKTWKAKNAAALNALPTKEADAIVRLWNERSRKLKESGK